MEMLQCIHDVLNNLNCEWDDDIRKRFLIYSWIISSSFQLRAAQFPAIMEVMDTQMVSSSFPQSWKKQWRSNWPWNLNKDLKKNHCTVFLCIKCWEPCYGICSLGERFKLTFSVTFWFVKEEFHMSIPVKVSFNF